MARRWFPLALAVTMLVAIIAPSGAAANSAYLGVWKLAAAANTPWANGGTLTIESSSRSEVQQFYNDGSTAGPQCLGYKEEVDEDLEPRPSAWFFLTYTWSGGGQMGGCISNKTGGQVVFFGKSADTDGNASTSDGKALSGYWKGPGAESSAGFMATRTGDPPDGGGRGDGTGCAGSASTTGSAAIVCGFGELGTFPVPDAGEPADISSARLPANTKAVEADVEVTDAEIDQFLATLALVKRRVFKREFNETYGACMVFGNADIGDEEPVAVFRISAVAAACLKLLSGTAKAAPTTTRAAARRCRVTVVPVWRRGYNPSPRRQRKAAAAYGRLVNTGCSSRAPGRLAFRVSARGESATLNRLLGKRARAGVVRSAPAGANDGPNAKMTVRWRRR